MKIDRMFFEKFGNRSKPTRRYSSRLRTSSGSGHRLCDQPTVRQTQRILQLGKLRRAAGVDRRLSLREILQRSSVCSPTSRVRMNCWRMNSAVPACQPEQADRRPRRCCLGMKYFFKAYSTDAVLRAIIDASDLES